MSFCRAPGRRSITANNLGDTITANNYGSTIIGGKGNDTVIAGTGMDHLTAMAATTPSCSMRCRRRRANSHKLDLSGIFSVINYVGIDPVKDGYLSFASDHHYANPHIGAGSVVVTTLDHLSLSRITTSDSSWHH